MELDDADVCSFPMHAPLSGRKAFPPPRPPQAAALRTLHCNILKMRRAPNEIFARQRPPIPLQWADQALSSALDPLRTSRSPAIRATWKSWSLIPPPW